MAETWAVGGDYFFSATGFRRKIMIYLNPLDGESSVHILTTSVIAVDEAKQRVVGLSIIMRCHLKNPPAILIPRQ